MKRLTPAQEWLLTRVIADGGAIHVGGLDGRKVRHDVLVKCINAGLLVSSWSGTSSCYKITELGKSALIKK